jgi:imidazolonepropionase
MEKRHDVLSIRNLSSLATPEGSEPRTGPLQGHIRRVENAAIRIEAGHITYAGPEAGFVERFGTVPAPHETVIDGRAKTALPGFIDAHTHLPWAGYRENEFNERLKGKTYAQIAAEGGGIVSTVSATRKATLEELTANVRTRLDAMLRHGTTCCEAKTGYGLEKITEIKQLRAMVHGSDGHPVTVEMTALPAHEIPLDCRGSEKLRTAYIDECCNEILPALAAEGASFSDVFCETGVYTLDESRKLLEAGKVCGLIPRIHADELTPLGGAQLAAEVGAISADHLLFVTPEGIEAMARSGVIATLLPGTSVFLRMNRYAPARDLINAGVPVAIATDCNPGSSFTESLPAVAFFAAIGMGLTVEETLTAITLNAAASVGLAVERGSLEPGKLGDVVLIDAPSVEHLVYHYGVNPVTDVVVNGHLAVSASRRV